MTSRLAYRQQYVKCCPDIFFSNRMYPALMMHCNFLAQCKPYACACKLLPGVQPFKNREYLFGKLLIEANAIISKTNFSIYKLGLQFIF